MTRTAASDELICDLYHSCRCIAGVRAAFSPRTREGVFFTLFLPDFTVALDHPVTKMVSEIGSRVISEPFVPLNMADFTNLDEPLTEYGLTLESIVNDTKPYTNASNPRNNEFCAFNDILQWSVAQS
jgi:hypothetical protein